MLDFNKSPFLMTSSILQMLEDVQMTLYVIHVCVFLFISEIIYFFKDCVLLVAATQTSAADRVGEGLGDTTNLVLTNSWCAQNGNSLSLKYALVIMVGSLKRNFIVQQNTIFPKYLRKN